MTREEQIGDARLILGDCREILNSLHSVDAIITDPPYGIEWDYEGYEDSFAAWRSLVDEVIPLSLSISGRMALSVGPLEAETHILSTHSPSWRACWYRGSTGARSPVGFRDWETIFLWGSMPRPMHDYLAFVPELEKNGHSCPKPVGYCKWFVERMSEPGEMVLDPFMGSGTTGVASAKLGRSFVGIELHPPYFDIACKRIEEAYKQADLFIERPTPTQESMPL